MPCPYKFEGGEVWGREGLTRHILLLPQQASAISLVLELVVRRSAFLYFLYIRISSKCCGIFSYNYISWSYCELLRYFCSGCLCRVAQWVSRIVWNVSEGGVGWMVMLGVQKLGSRPYLDGRGMPYLVFSSGLKLHSSHLFWVCWKIDNVRWLLPSLVTVSDFFNSEICLVFKFLKNKWNVFKAEISFVTWDL